MWEHRRRGRRLTLRLGVTADRVIRLTFDEWVVQSFDRPVTKRQWHLATDVEVWEGLAEYVSRSLVACDELLAVYGRAGLATPKVLLSSRRRIMMWRSNSCQKRRQN